MNKDLLSWNSDMIRVLFGKEENVFILSILLSLRRREDKYTWVYSKDGSYTVKSAYQHLKGIHANHAMNTFYLWKYIWGAEVPPKVKSFTWRLLNNILLVKSRLREKGIGIINTCPRCSKEETILHTFFECEKARGCWRLLGIQLQSTQLRGLLGWTELNVKNLPK